MKISVTMNESEWLFIKSVLVHDYLWHHKTKDILNTIDSARKQSLDQKDRHNNSCMCVWCNEW